MGQKHRETSELAAAVRRVLPSVRADLERLVRIPSVSADPAAAADLQASAREVAALLRGASLPEAEVTVAGGSKPAVLAHRPGPPGAPMGSRSSAATCSPYSASRWSRPS